MHWVGCALGQHLSDGFYVRPAGSVLELLAELRAPDEAEHASKPPAGAVDTVQQSAPGVHLH